MSKKLLKIKKREIKKILFQSLYDKLELERDIRECFNKSIEETSIKGGKRIAFTTNGEKPFDPTKMTHSQRGR